MSPQHGRIVCNALEGRAASLMTVSEGHEKSRITTDGHRHACHEITAPYGGVYLLFQDRALQIAGFQCDKRGCQSICYCDRYDTYASLVEIEPRENLNSVKQPFTWPAWRDRPCYDCLAYWLNLYQAAQETVNLRLQFFQHPETLTMSKKTYNSDGTTYYALEYDSALDERNVRSKDNGTRGPWVEEILEWMKYAWNEFLARGKFPPNIIVPFDTSDEEDDEDDEDESEYDDLDIPLKNVSDPKTSKRSDEFDFIDDLIDEEFPQLRKKYAAEQKPEPNHPRAADDGNSSEDDSDYEDPPAPIIPPKNMTLGRGFERPAKPQAPGMMRPRKEATTSAAPAAAAVVPRSPLGRKRAHSAFVEDDSDTDSEPPRRAIPAPLAKYQKLGPATPRNSNSNQSGYKLSDIDFLPSQVQRTTDMLLGREKAPKRYPSRRL
ncbi:hypothetical protein F4818DRAFT_436637 [Hypoxylon cercidicola]|nr:hypothetical protein F4818DRAFT_436637 [Hypoxylon cercidicola]